MDIKAIIESHLPEGTELPEKVINSITKDIKTEQGKEFVPNEDYGKKTLKIDELEKEIKNLSVKAADVDTYKKKVEDLEEAHKKELETKQKEYDALKNEAESKKIKESKTNALFKQLKEDGANEKLIKLLAAQFDLEKIELDGEKIKDWDSISKTVKEEYKDVFGKVKTKGTDPANPPRNDPSNPEPKTLSEALKAKYETEDN